MTLVGIDTSLCLTSLVRGTTITVLADATAWLGRVPDFVIRPTGGGGGAAVPLSAAEIAALSGVVGRIAGYYNDSPLSAASPVTGTFAQGVADARAARAQLRALGFPDSCPVLIDLEHWQVVTPSYVTGIRGIEPSAIVYGSGQTCSVARAGGLRSWISSWQPQGNYQNEAAKALQGGNSMWQVAGNAFNGIADEDLADAALVQTFWDGKAPASGGLRRGADAAAFTSPAPVVGAGAVVLTVPPGTAVTVNGKVVSA